MKFLVDLPRNVMDDPSRPQFQSEQRCKKTQQGDSDLLPGQGLKNYRAQKQQIVLVHQRHKHKTSQVKSVRTPRVNITSVP